MYYKEITPRSNIDADVRIPGSKSYTNRALIISALAVGESVLKGVVFCDDTNYMIEALKKFGTGIEHYNGDLLVKPSGNPHYDGRIYVGNAGTTMRFLTGFCSLGFGNVELYGTERMHERPIGDLVDALNNIVVDGEIECKSVNAEGKRCPPVHVKSGMLWGGITTLRGDLDSQYLSSLLMISPYAFESNVKIWLISPLVSERPYVNMTIDIMRQFGAEVDDKYDYGQFFEVTNKLRYSGIEYAIESDASNMSYFMAAAAITGGRVRINNANPDSAQGDIKFMDLLEKMGCAVIKGSDYVEVHGPKKLKATDANMSYMPDVAQTLAVLAAVADGVTNIQGIGILRDKETDRIQALENELGKVGVRTESTQDSLIIYGGEPHGATIKTYDDHRMIMSFSDLGLKVPGIVIEEPEHVSKSFPSFYEVFDTL